MAGIRAVLGAGWQVDEVQAPAVSDGDGGSGSPASIAAARGAEIYLGFGVPPGVVKAGQGSLRSRVTSQPAIAQKNCGEVVTTTSGRG